MIQSISGLIPAQQSQYLKAVRSGPGFLGFRDTQNVFFQKHFTDNAHALELISEHGHQSDTWVSMATYSDPNASRSQDNAEGLCALWLDVDAHEEGKYENFEEVQTALQGFITQTDLPKPTLLNLTGYGVHAIWIFSEVITREEWQPIADKLQDLSGRLFLGADPITTDAARILRVPGTLNFRDRENPKLSTFLETGIGYLKFDEMALAIDKALLKFPPLVKTRGKHASVKKFDSPATESNIDLVNAMLSTIDPDVSYCKWRDVVWAVAATGWDCSSDLAFSWSSKGATWNEVTFNRVWDGFDASRGIGFGTLAHHAKNAGYLGSLPSKALTQQLKPTGRLITVCAADIKPEHVEWLVDQSLPLGMLVVIGGQPGLGKSQISINLAAGVTTGVGLPGAGSFKDLGSVIILANEDDAARTIRPRLDAAGADISKVHIVQGVAREGADVDVFQLDLDIADLRDRAFQIGDLKLIIIDPPSAYLGTKVDSYKDSDVRRVLMPLSTLAQDTGAMILLIVHLNKRTDGGPQQRFAGSTAWTAAPRVGFMVAEDQLTKQRFMVPVKNNIGDDRFGYQYHIEEKLVQYGGQTFKSSCIVWDQTTNRSVGELLAPPKVSKPNVVSVASDFLQGELAEAPLPVERLKEAAKVAGISWSSVLRAKSSLLITSEKIGAGWTWTLLAAKGNGNV
jgi:putative DNA primase/helicase